MNITSNDSSTTSTATTTAINSSSNCCDLGLHFLDMARAGASNVPQSDDESDSEEYPSELNTLNSSAGFLVVSTDKLSVKYTAVNLHGHAVGAVQANKPAPVERLVYYFEMFVKEAGSKGQVSIGFTTAKFKMRRHPGWEANSIGYHGDDGLLYRGQAKGEAFGPTYSAGDIVGGGINYASREIFFTKNGIMVGAVHKDLRGPLFPTVAVHSQGEEVHVNFGQRCFAFDLKAFEAQERLKQQSAMENIPLPPNITYEIVRSYLIHYGYEDTLNSLYMATQSTSTVPVDQTNGFTEADIYALSQKRTLRQLIRSGNIDTAVDRLREWYPQNAQDDRDCLFLYCQKFIELVRVGELEEAVKYGRVQLRKFFDVPECKKIVEKCVSLLAFEHPEDSFVGFLLKDSQRELVADMVNLMVLSTYIDTPARLRSPLERLLRQLAGCCLELRFLNGNQGEVFNLSKLLEATSKGNTP